MGVNIGAGTTISLVVSTKEARSDFPPPQSSPARGEEEQ